MGVHSGTYAEPVSPVRVLAQMRNYYQISYVFDQNWRFFFKSAIFSLWVYRREFNPASFPDSGLYIISDAVGLISIT